MRSSFKAAYAALCIAVSISGQVTGGPRFEVASVKLAGDKTPFSGFTGGPGSSRPGRIQYSPVAMRTLICDALMVKRDQVSGAAWIDLLSYVVSATLSPNSTRQDLSAMTLHLLEERFAFAFHRETRDAERLQLRVESSGPKLGQPVSNPVNDPNEVMTLNSAGPRAKDPRGFPVLAAGPAWAQQRGEDGMMRLTCKSCSMRFLGSVPLATLLSRQQGLAPGGAKPTVYDQTDLAGQYDFHLLYVPAPLVSGGAEPSSVPGDDLASALRHQLGLRIVSVKAPIEFIVVDHLNRIPTGN